MVTTPSLTTMGTALAVPLFLARAPRMSVRVSPSRTTAQVTDAKAVVRDA